MWRDHYVGNVMNEMALAKPRYCKLIALTWNMAKKMRKASMIRATI